MSENDAHPAAPPAEPPWPQDQRDPKVHDGFDPEPRATIVFPRSDREDRERGTSAVEYALILVGICSALAAIFFAVGPIINGALDKGCAAVTNSQVTACPQGGKAP